jgi:heme/copper-type cytochrome/quinol oxidase subunit 2
MRQRMGRSIWAFIGFLALFCFLLELLTKFYLLRALADFKVADEAGKKLIGIHALLMMCAVLIVLGLSWMMIFRVGRYFFPRQGEQGEEREAKTKYTDAWTEAGKRMRPPEE